MEPGTSAQQVGILPPDHLADVSLFQQKHLSELNSHTTKFSVHSNSKKEDYVWNIGIAKELYKGEGGRSCIRMIWHNTQILALFTVTCLNWSCG